MSSSLVLVMVDLPKILATLAGAFAGLAEMLAGLAIVLAGLAAQREQRWKIMHRRWGDYRRAQRRRMRPESER